MSRCEVGKLRQGVVLLSILTLFAITPQSAGAQGGSFHIWMDSTAAGWMGARATITLSVSGGIRAGAFNLLFGYNSAALGFLDIEPLGVVADWEYFTYRIFSPDDCGPECDTRLVRVFGIADLADGQDPGDVFSIEGQIMQITLRTPKRCDYIAQCFPLQWTWRDCDDNSLTSVTGDTIYLASDIEYILPDENCLAAGLEERRTDLNFVTGFICMIPPPDDRGDINLNGLPWGIGDAVLFSNSFIYGLGALGYPDDPYWLNRRLATDINDDGVPLTYADLVWLVQIICGSAKVYGSH